MTTFEFGDVVRAPFPHVERAVVVVRPALVVASRDAGPIGELLWVLMITNAARADWSGDVPIPEAVERGLLIASKVRTAKISTVAASAVTHLGSLDRASTDVVRTILSMALRGRKRAGER